MATRHLRFHNTLPAYRPAIATMMRRTSSGAHRLFARHERCMPSFGGRRTHYAIVKAARRLGTAPRTKRGDFSPERERDLDRCRPSS